MGVLLWLVHPAVTSAPVAALYWLSATCVSTMTLFLIVLGIRTRRGTAVAESQPPRWWDSLWPPPKA
jgi:hypothetical protein